MEVNLNLADIVRFGLVLLRVSSLFAVLPVFGSKSTPNRIKILFAAALSLVVALGIEKQSRVTFALDLSLIWIAVREALTGLSLGFVSAFIFHGVEYAGEIVGTQMGFAIGNVIDSQSARQASMIGEFQRVLLILLFLSINGHHMILSALFDSYAALPIGGMGFNAVGAHGIVLLAGKVFAIAVRLAAPATIMLLLVNVSLGVISRTIPQMNIFIVGFPLTITAGILMLAFSIPAFVNAAGGLVEELQRDLSTVLRVL